VKKGLFISLEGIDGSGKTTHAYLLKDSLSSQGFEVVMLDDEFTTRIGKGIRTIVSESPRKSVSQETGVLLAFAERVQLIAEVIRPALSEGKIVIVEGFTDGTMCYDGCGYGAALSTLSAVDKVCTGGMRPNLTVLLDLPFEEAHRRVVESGKADRIKDRDAAFYGRVRKGFLDVARREPHRVKVVDSSREIDDVFFSICRFIYDEMNPT
jgi:dTMP kinase